MANKSVDHQHADTEQRIKKLEEQVKPAAKKFPEIEVFPAVCRIPVWPFVVLVKAGQRTPPE